ncbi:hypothetical protein L6164_007776 [Bauhinia variegata]|uniref:Uncharacterized protein n=1 Tax=Bauhinia variegata TaxID=167791 RepID=A0ACB9PEY0_BAUVA|nr:hypothetical protein L6164_007776 [Bauhinia variegata]
MASEDRFGLLEETTLKMEEDYKTSRSKIQVVPSYVYMQEEKKYEKYYSPKLISFGPIHHGDPKLKRGEQYKLMWTSMYAKARSLTPQDLYKRISNHIGELRGLFSWDEHRQAKNYSDKDLAWMLFVDGCSVLQILEKVNLAKPEEYLKVKVDILVIVERDLFLLENQLPYQLLKLLNSDELKLKICMYAFCELQNMFTIFESSKGLLFRDPKRLIKIVKKSSSPTHLLDCLRTNILSIGNDKDEQEQSSLPAHIPERGSVLALILNALCTSIFEVYVRQIFVLGFHKLQNMFTLRKPEHGIKRWKTSSLPRFERESERGKQSSPPPILDRQTSEAERSSETRLSWRLAALVATTQERYNTENFTSYRNIQELKVAAIQVKRQKNISLKNISFSSSLFYGKLNLPPLILNDTTVPILLNLAAYETCPDFINKFEISSYIKLLDLLIDEPEDVKELRSSGILHNSLGCDEDVVELFNTISSGLVHNPILYSGIKDKMEKHYRNKLRNIMAGAYYTYFKTPWSFIASAAAVSALALTALQTWKAF